MNIADDSTEEIKWRLSVNEGENFNEHWSISESLDSKDSKMKAIQSLIIVL